MKNAHQPIDQAISRIICSARGASVFTPAQFGDFGSPAAIRQTLSRLVKAGKIRRVRQGIYDCPRQHPIVGETPPDVMATVRALTKGSQAKWQFSGAYAANLLGLSDQVPAKIIILTDGAPRRVALEKLILTFRRVSPRNLLAAGKPAGLVFQALRYLGQTGNTSKYVSILKRKLDARTKRELESLAPKMPAWMRPLVQEIIH